MTIEGVVVGDYQATPASSAASTSRRRPPTRTPIRATSEGIFVFDNGFGADVRPATSSACAGRSPSSAASPSSARVDRRRGLLDRQRRHARRAVSLPVASLDDLERYEGMLVQFSQTLTATEVFNLGRFGEVSLSGAGRLYTRPRSRRRAPPRSRSSTQNNRSRIILDDGNNQQNIDPTRYPQGGLSASEHAARRRHARRASPASWTSASRTTGSSRSGRSRSTTTNPRTAAPAPVGGNLKVASFNVLNFFNGNGLGGGFPTSRGANTQFELDRQKAKEVSALHGDERRHRRPDGDRERRRRRTARIEELVAGAQRRDGRRARTRSSTRA